MRKYIFLVRPWNVDFFVHLADLIKKSEPEAQICYWTMQANSIALLREHGIEGVFLPEAFESTELNTKQVVQIDRQLINEFGLGLNFLCEMERFKPSADRVPDFIGRQVCWLQKNLPQGATLISLTGEHFVYILTGYLNRLKGGGNLYAIPTGFPLKANAICESPWELRSVHADALPLDCVDEYRASLALNPLKSVHYMQAQNGPAFKHRVKSLLKRLFTPQDKELDSIFNYIRPTQITAADKRKKKQGIPVALNYLGIEEIKQASSQSRVFYFPLQYEPEMSILAYSPYYKDQREVARLISQSLDYGDILVIKENPKMHGKRGAEFYHYFNGLPNVRWVDPAANSREVVRAVFKVVATTGTATMEAAMLERPSMIFGRPPFRDLLAQAPLTDLAIGEFRQYLYEAPSPEEIAGAFGQGWSIYSKSLFFGDFVPRFVKGKRTTQDTENLANRFYSEVVHLIQDPEDNNTSHLPYQR